MGTLGGISRGGYEGARWAIGEAAGAAHEGVLVLDAAGAELVLP